MENNVSRSDREASWYQAVTGKSFDTRPQIAPDRSDLINKHAAIIASFENMEIGCDEFCAAFCAVMDMYEAHLDAACDLNDGEVDELCFRLFMPRSGFNRYVRIAKLQKQVPCEIESGIIEGKKWALDPSLLQE